MTVNAVLSKNEEGIINVEIVDGTFAGSIFTVDNINNEEESCDITYDHVCVKLVIDGELQTNMDTINKEEILKEYFSTMSIFMTDLFNNALKSYIDANPIQPE